MRSRSSQSNFVNTALIYIVGSFLVQGVSFLTLPVFTMLMSPRDFGLYTSYENWISIITILLGLQTTASITNAYIDYPGKRLQPYISSVSSIGFLSFLCIVSLTILIKKPLTSIFELTLYQLLMGVVQCLFSYLFTMLINEYRVMDKPLQYLAFSSFNVMLNIILGILLISTISENKYKGRIWGSLLAAVSVGIVSGFIIFKNGKKLLDIDNLKYALKLSIPLVFHGFAGVIMGKTDQMMLLKLTSSTEMGIYSYGNKIGHIIYVLYTAINQAFVPWYYKKMHSNEKDFIVSITRKYINLFSLITILCLLLLPEIIHIITPASYEGAIYSAPLIVVGFYMNFLYTFPINYEFYHKKTNYIAIGTTGSAVMNIILNAMLIPLYGGQGAAIATIISYMTLILLHLLIVQKIIGGYELESSFFIKRIFFMVIVLVGYFVFLKRIWLRLFLATMLGVIIVAVILKNLKKIQ